MRRLVTFLALIAAAFGILPAHAVQVDIHGPPGSHEFGDSVTVLPNGNFVVTDLKGGPGTNFGAVHLYSPVGTLISTLTGSSPNDYVGNGGVFVVGDSNFVVVSLSWNNNAATSAGAVTWVDGSTGLSGVVSASNSLVGSTSSDNVGGDYHGFTVLSNGNYVVSSSHWNNGSPGSNVGAATWGNGNGGTVGPVSASNSLVGTTANDQVGANGVTALSNGNYVVKSPTWKNGAGPGGGAVTWGNGNGGTVGPVSASNSLFGTTDNDRVGYSDYDSYHSVIPLSNGNYVVVSTEWNNGDATQSHFGAVTWGNGNGGTVGPVSVSNSLIGSTVADRVGIVTALSNGNYVVSSPHWYNGAAAMAGAATWGNGNGGTVGPVSVSNSLVGSVSADYVGEQITALTNGNYVVISLHWNAGVLGSQFGAVTWGNGATGIAGAVSASNSLVGSTVQDQVGANGVTALSNGNFVVESPRWSNGVGVTHGSVGAATWGNGATGIVGTLSASNSLVGSHADDRVGTKVTALSDGNYVVSSNWNGAVTWGNGSFGATGVLSANNSLIGTSGFVTALTNGNYVASSPGQIGAVTWRNGGHAFGDVASDGNSLIGTYIGDDIGEPYNIASFSDGNYVILSPDFNGGRGAVTLASGRFRLQGTIQSWNSVLGGTVPYEFAPRTNYAYDSARHQLIVGRPMDNIVSLFSMEQVFASDFEP